MGQSVQKPRPWDKTLKTEFSSRGITEEPNGANLLEGPVLMVGLGFLREAIPAKVQESVSVS